MDVFWEPMRPPCGHDWSRLVMACGFRAVTLWRVCVGCTEGRLTDRGFRNPANYAARLNIHAGQLHSIPTTTKIRTYTLTIPAGPTSVGRPS